MLDFSVPQSSFDMHTIQSSTPFPPQVLYLSHSLFHPGAKSLTLVLIKHPDSIFFVAKTHSQLQ